MRAVPLAGGHLWRAEQETQGCPVEKRNPQGQKKTKKELEATGTKGRGVEDQLQDMCAPGGCHQMGADPRTAAGCPLEGGLCSQRPDGAHTSQDTAGLFFFLRSADILNFSSYLHPCTLVTFRTSFFIHSPASFWRNISIFEIRIVLF